MSRRQHTPERLCVGCGRRAAQADLTRFIATAQGLTLDVRRCAPGRGAYLHAADDCWQAFVGRKPPLRSLRRSFDRRQRSALIAEIRETLAR